MIFTRRGLLAAAAGSAISASCSSPRKKAQAVSLRAALQSAGLPTGSTLDYVENRDGVIKVTARTEGNNGAQLLIQGRPVEYDGTSLICVEIGCSAVEPDFNNAIQFNLYEDLGPSGTVDMGIVTTSGTGGKPADFTRSSFSVCHRRYFTPPAGTHTYQIRVWATGGSLNRVYCGFGGGPDPGDPPNYMPAYMRVTVA